MNNYLMVFLGGGLGSVVRYSISVLYYRNNPAIGFPFATLTANIVSSLILGIVLGSLSGKNPLSSGTVLFLSAGFCGGFSTFSTFSFETIELLRSGAMNMAFLNMILNLGLCLASVFAGLYLSRNIFS